jgi:hypothetical protein
MFDKEFLQHSLWQINGNNRADWIPRNNAGRKRHQPFQSARHWVFLRSKALNFPQWRGSLRMTRRTRINGNNGNRGKTELACELQRHSNRRE